MSSYPPTPAFGIFSFLPPKPPALASASQKPTDRHGTEPPGPIKQPNPTSRQIPTASRPPPSDKSKPIGITESSDSMEEGELSEPETVPKTGVAISNGGFHRNSAKSAYPHSDLSITSNWNPPHKPPGSFGTMSTPPYPRNSAFGGNSLRGPSNSAATRNLGPPCQRGGADKETLGVITSGRKSRAGHGVSSVTHSPSHSCPTSASGYGAALPGQQIHSSKRQEAEKALLDMMQCNVQFNDVIRETGVNPDNLRSLFVAIGVSVPDSAVLKTGDDGPLKGDTMSNSREPSSDNTCIGGHAQMIRKQLEKEKRDRERKEAEAKASELVRQRDAAKEEEERQRRSVEVQAAREAFQKKIQSLNLKKAVSPSAPLTPISSNPVNITVAKAHPHPISTSSPISAVPRIPGLLLGQLEHKDQTAAAPGLADVVMKDVLTEPSPTTVDQLTTARRKRPAASDLYHEANPLKRKFGTQHSNSLIIEVSEDEEEDHDSHHLSPQARGEELRSDDGTPQTPLTNRTTNLQRRAQPVSANGFVTNGQSEALRKTEAEIRRLKEQIEAAQQKKKLAKAGSSTVPTPVATPAILSGPTLPPPQIGASQLSAEMPVKNIAASSVAVANDSICITSNSDAQAERDRQDAQLKEEEAKERELQVLLKEKQQKALMEAENKRKEARRVAKALQEEREKKKRRLLEIESMKEQKRIAREKLKAQMERIRQEEEEILREEQEAEELKISLAQELDESEQAKESDLAPEPQSVVDGGVGVEVHTEFPKGPNAVKLETSLVTTSFPPPEATFTNSQSSSKVLDTDTVFVRSISASAPPDKEGTGNPLQVLRVPPAFDIPQIQTRITPTAEVADNMDIDIASDCTTPGFSVSQEDVDMELSSSDEDSLSEEPDESDDDDGSNMIDRQDKQEISDVVSVQTVAHINTADAEVSDETRVLSASVSTISLEQEHGNSHAVLPKAETISNAFTPYTSPLAIFKSFRHHPKYHDFVPSGLRSLQYSNRINPDIPLCKYEVNGGICNDSKCEWQHFRDLPIGDDEILVQLAEVEGATQQQKDAYSAGLRNTIMDLKEKGIKDFATVAQGIAAFRRSFLGDQTRVVKLPPSPPPI